MKLPKIPKHDAVIGGVLLCLIILELYVKKDEFMGGRSPFILLIGALLGFSAGFKLSALHSASGIKKALNLAENEKRDGENLEKVLKDKIQGNQAIIEKQDKTIGQLEEALQDRDLEIRELIIDLEKYREKHGRI